MTWGSNATQMKENWYEEREHFKDVGVWCAGDIKIYLKEIEWEISEWISLAQYRYQLLADVKTNER